jgi:hypothetical protein
MASKKIQFKLTAVDRTKAAFDKVSKSLKTVGGGAMKAAKLIGGIGLAAVGAVAALGLLVKTTFSFIDAIGKTATRTGITTSAIQAFHLAARESGTNVEGANKALEKFARSVGDAQRGLKTTKDIFQSLGVSLSTNEGHYKSTTQLLEETAIGISKLGSQTEKATALANLFGRQGILLTGALEDLAAKGMDGFIERAENLGLVLSNKSIRSVEAFNDAVGVIGMQLNAIKANIMIAFLPIFEKIRATIAEKMADVKNSFGGFDAVAVAVVNNTIEGFANMLAAIDSFVDFAQGSLGGIRIAYLLLAQGVDVVTLAIQALLSNFIEGDAGFQKTVDRMKENTSAIQNLWLGTNKYNNELLHLAGTLKTYKVTLADVQDAQKKFADEQKNSVNSTFDSMNALTAFKNSITGTDGLSNALDGVAVNSMKKFEDSIVEGIKTGKFAFKDFASYVVEQLIRVAIQQLIIARLVDPFRALFGFSGSSASTPIDKPKSGRFFYGDGGGFTGMGARAGGVDGKGGFPAILHPNETVIDHTKGQGMGATVNFNISTVDAASFDELLASRKGLITSIINNAMNNQGKMGVV